MSEHHEKVVIVEGVRTPYVKSGTKARNLSAVDLGRTVVKELFYRTAFDPNQLDEVIVGNIGQPADAPNVGRVIALESGVPEHVPAYTVQRNCASGMEALAAAVRRIEGGDGHAYVAAGVESMTNIPFLYPRSFADKLMKIMRAKTPLQKLSAIMSLRGRDFKPIIALEVGLTDPFCGLNMGDTAEVLAKEFRISREEQDAYALKSHQKTIHAWKEGILAKETVPLYVAEGKKWIAIEEDFGPRDGLTMEKLAKMKPYFDRKYGTVTVANSCPITDGAAAMLVMSEKKARELGKEPLAFVRTVVFAGLDPKRMGLGPTFSSAKAFRQTGLTLEDMDLIEINEAFSAQVLANLKAFASRDFARKYLGQDEALGEIDEDKLNVNGGAIAMGHPVGSSGTRIVMTLARELQRRNLRRGLATLCIGGGQGGAVILER